MKRNRIIFAVIIGIAVVIVAVSVILRATGAEQRLTVTPEGPIEVRLLTALPVEPWVRAAADRFNQENHTLEGADIQIDVIAMEALFDL